MCPCKHALHRDSTVAHRNALVIEIFDNYFSLHNDPQPLLQNFFKSVRQQRSTMATLTITNGCLLRPDLFSLVKVSDCLTSDGVECQCII